ncbi:hypothetical protein OROGR_004929 [Orobanche gracilis]
MMSGNYTSIDNQNVFGSVSGNVESLDLGVVLLWSSNGALYGAPLHTCRESNGGCRTYHHR